MPRVKDGPEGLNKILEAAYQQCMEYQREHGKQSKQDCAKIAWGAAKKAGWHKKDGKWVKGD